MLFISPTFLFFLFPNTCVCHSTTFYLSPYFIQEYDSEEDEEDDRQPKKKKKRGMVSDYFLEEAEVDDDEGEDDDEDEVRWSPLSCPDAVEWLWLLFFWGWWELYFGISFLWLLLPETLCNAEKEERFLTLVFLYWLVSLIYLFIL